MEILGLLFVLALLAALVLPWMNLARISGMRRELERLRRELHDLKDGLDVAGRAL
jgi:uncharacterized integral membrane protein